MTSYKPFVFNIINYRSEMNAAGLEIRDGQHYAEKLASIRMKFGKDLLKRPIPKAMNLPVSVQMNMKKFQSCGHVLSFREPWHEKFTTTIRGFYMRLLNIFRKKKLDKWGNPTPTLEEKLDKISHRLMEQEKKTSELEDEFKTAQKTVELLENLSVTKPYYLKNEYSYTPGGILANEHECVGYLKHNKAELWIKKDMPKPKIKPKAKACRKKAKR